MSAFLTARRRALQGCRSGTLRRALTTTTHVDVACAAALSLYGPDKAGQGDIRMGDGLVAILNDEIEAAGWPGPPTVRDVFLLDGKRWQILGVFPAYDGTLLIGYSLTVRGG